jgi:hypothetical protein
VFAVLETDRLARNFRCSNQFINCKIPFTKDRVGEPLLFQILIPQHYGPLYPEGMSPAHILDSKTVVAPPLPPAYAPENFQGVDLNSSFRNLDLSRGALGSVPKPEQLIAHLKLLEAFQQLREDVSLKDGLFGINDSIALVSGTNGPPAIIAKVREKRWAIYVARAANRFQAWWETCVCGVSSLRPLNQDDLAEKSFAKKSLSTDPMDFSKDTLPPLGMLSGK